MCDLFVKYFPIIKDAFITFVAVGGFFIALFGLKTWRKELKGKTEYDLARRILKAVYKIRNSIRNVRNPSMSGAEIPKSKEATKEAEIRGFIQAYQQRSATLYEALADLDVAVLEAEVIWGQQIVQDVKPLARCTSELILNLNRYFRTLWDDNYGKRMPPKRAEEMNDVIYAIDDAPEEDKFNSKLLEAIHKIEDYIKPHLQK